MDRRIIITTLVVGVARLAHADPENPSEADALADATKLEASYRAKLGGDDKPAVEQLFALTAKAPANMRESAGIALSDQAAFLAGQGADPSVFITLAAEAVHLAPHSALAWNNLGGLLRQVDARASLVPLRRALALQPDAPAVLVNLGSSLAQLGDKRGVATLREVIKKQPRMGVAHQALASVLLVENDKAGAKTETEAAIADGMAGPEVEQLAGALEVTTRSPSSTFSSDDGFSFSAGKETRVTPAKLVLPGEMPQWKNREEFLRDSTRWGPVSSQLLEQMIKLGFDWAAKYHGVELRQGIADGIEKARAAAKAKGKPLPPAQHEFDLGKLVGPTTVPTSPLSAHVRLQFEATTFDYNAKVMKHAHAFIAKYRAAGEAFKNDMKPASDRFQARTKACGVTPECFCAAMEDFTKASDAAANKLLRGYRDGVSEWNEARRDIYKYWDETGPLLGQILDQPTFDYAEELRRVVVTGWSADFWATMGFSAIGIALPFSPMQCTKAAPPSSTIATGGADGSTSNEAPEVFEADTATKLPCPDFLKSQKGFKLFGVTAKLDCDGGEVSFTKGIALGVKYKFASHEMEVFVGLGGSSTLSTYDPLSVTAKIGATATFADGKMVDAGGKAEVEGTFDADGLQGKVKVSATWTVVTPPDITVKSSAVYAYK